ncbi:MAG TPA: glycosyltransferase family 8 protein, partial [Chitinophagaceae bacterium]|nr:glycosyltransferase family 8 protein [Chitinophagaceae bacterium]
MVKISKTPVHVGFCFDERYLLPFYVTVTSLLNQSKTCEIFIHAIVTGLGSEAKRNIEYYINEIGASISFYEIDLGEVKKLVIPRSGHFTSANYYRLFLPSMLSDRINKILYLDTDILVVNDVFELYSFDLGNNLIGAALDNEMPARPEIGFNTRGQYFNSGVLLINVKLWKTRLLKKALINYIINHPDLIKYVDQDALNVIVGKQWCRLDNRFNLMNEDVQRNGNSVEPDKYLADKTLIHYNGFYKPWEIECKHPFKQIYIQFC